MCVFFLPSNHFARQNLCRTERKYAFTVLIFWGPADRICPPTDSSVVFRTCQLVASRLFGQSQSFIFDRFCRQILWNRFYQDVKTGPYTYLSDLLLRTLVVGRRQKSQVFGVRFEPLDWSKCEGSSSGSLRSDALMGYM